VLGHTGRNFAAGMSGGLAYVLDTDGSFASNCNRGMVDLETLADEEDLTRVRALIMRHVELTGSAVGERVLRSWSTLSDRFVVVVPREFKRVRAARVA
jgi:glutamate synthase (ferredoxin)